MVITLSENKKKKDYKKAAFFIEAQISWGIDFIQKLSSFNTVFTQII